jgi:hypothetical protein
MPRTDRRLLTVLRFAAVLCAYVSLAKPARICLAADTTPSLAAPALTGDFKIGKDGRLVLLPVTIGSKTISCLVDNGASLSAFDVTLKEALGKPQGTRLLKTAAGLVRVETYGWPEARLGDRVLQTDRPVACLELRHFQQAINEPILGVLGMDLLRLVPIQIDFDEGIFRFLPSLPVARDELGVKIPLRFLRDGTPVLVGSPGAARREDFVIDTGAQGNSLREYMFDELLDQGNIRVGTMFTSVTATGAARGQRGRLDKICVGPLEHEGLRFSRLGYSSLGLRYFSRFVVTFDFPDECVYLRRGAHHARPEPVATSGLTLTWDNESPVVESVRADGPGAKAGLARFDVLVRINGRDAAEYDHFALRELLTSEVGRRVRMTVRRGNRLLDLVVELGED